MIAVTIWILLGFSVDVVSIILHFSKTKKLKTFGFFGFSYSIILGPFIPIFIACNDKDIPRLTRVFIIVISLTLSIGGYVTEKTKVFKGCVCMDGWHSSSTGSGTCAWHGGIKRYEYSYWWE